MADKYHVNEKGEIKPCAATVKACPVKGPDGEKAPHYTNETEAKQGAEQALAAVHGSGLASSKKTPQDYLKRTAAEEAEAELQAEKKHTAAYKAHWALVQADNEEKVAKACKALGKALGQNLEPQAGESWEETRARLHRDTEAATNDLLASVEAHRKNKQAALDKLNTGASTRRLPGGQATVEPTGYTTVKGQLAEGFTVVPTRGFGVNKRNLTARKVTLAGAEGHSPEEKAKLAAYLGHLATGATAGAHGTVQSEAQVKDLLAVNDGPLAGRDLAVFGTALESGIDHTKLGVSFAGDAKQWDARTKRLYSFTADHRYKKDRLAGYKEAAKFLQENPGWQGEK